jgi:hypothetical protein
MPDTRADITHMIHLTIWDSLWIRIAVSSKNHDFLTDQLSNHKNVTKYCLFTHHEHRSTDRTQSNDAHKDKVENMQLKLRQ